ncbi:hypothetical protein AADR41_10770 [Streptomyces sp. CLV115]
MPDEGWNEASAALAPYIDNGVLAQQITHEEAQRRALATFLDGWGATGGG